MPQVLSTGPSRDTRAPPNVTPCTRVIGILGLDEPDKTSLIASPSSDGWIVSDFYLWLHVLHDMGKSQEWITSMAPGYLLEKYDGQNETTMETPEEKMKWEPGLVHGDSWEQRVVVLDDSLLGGVNRKLTIGPHGVCLQDFFLERLEAVVADASKTNDPVLMLAFCHGDYDTRGGLYIGHTSGLLCPDHVAGIMSRYPKVRISMYMNSCYSGHWVETTEFAAGADPEESSFGCVWSHSQRHAGGLFSLPTTSELDLSQEYYQMTADITAEVYCLCLPGNIFAYGSSPVFTDSINSRRFWRRTGYALQCYKANYDTLKRIPASDLHPNRACEKDPGNESNAVEWTKKHTWVFDEDNYPESTAGYGVTRRGLGSLQNINHIVRLYVKAQRGCEAYSETRLVDDKIRMYRQNPDDPDKQGELRKMLTARIALDKMADQYRQALALSTLPMIEIWDAQNRGPKTDKFARIITESRVFAIFPREILVYSYRRPAQYLAAEMAAAKYAEVDVHCAVEKLQCMKAQGRFTDVACKDYLGSTGYKCSVESLRKMQGKSRVSIRPNLPTGQEFPLDGRHNTPMNEGLYGKGRVM